MSRIPLIVHTAGWVQLLPACALLARRNLSRPVLWVVAGSTVSVVGNLLGRVAAHRVGNNHWLAYIDSPLMFALYYAALSEWQVSPREARWARAGILVLLVAYTLVVALLEDVTTFPLFAAAMLAIGLLTGGIWTLVRRTFTGFRPTVLGTDWFWIIGGLTLYGATTAAVAPVARILLAAQRIDLFTMVYSLRAVCIDIAFLLVAAGCCIPPAPADAIP